MGKPSPASLSLCLDQFLAGTIRIIVLLATRNSFLLKRLFLANSSRQDPLLVWQECHSPMNRASVLTCAICNCPCNNLHSVNQATLLSIFTLKKKSRKEKQTLEVWQTNCIGSYVSPTFLVLCRGILHKTQYGSLWVIKSKFLNLFIFAIFWLMSQRRLPTGWKMKIKRNLHRNTIFSLLKCIHWCL